MPKHKRTREQKKRAVARKIEQHSYTFSETSAKTIENQVLPKETNSLSLNSFFNYDVNLIYKDIVKTVVISTLLIGTLVGISLFMK